MGNTTEEKMLTILKIKLSKMTSNELKDYLSKFNVEVPDVIDENFLKRLLSVVRNNSIRTVKTGKETRFQDTTVGVRTTSAVNHWIPDIENSDFAIKRKTIIVLPGNLTTTPAKANGSCKIVEKLLGLTNESENVVGYDLVDVMGFCYGKDKEDSPGAVSPKEISAFVDRFIMPLCVKNGNLLPIETIMENFGNITFVSHCYGSLALDGIIQDFANKLKGMSFSEEQIRGVLAQSLQVSYSPLSQNAPVPTVRIDSLADVAHKDLAEEYETVHHHKLDGIAVEYYKEGSFRGRKNPHEDSFDIINIYVTNMKDYDGSVEESTWRDREHSLKRLARNEDWSYMAGGKIGDTVSIMASHSIAWSIIQSMMGKNSGFMQSKTPLNEELLPLLLDLATMYSKQEKY